MYDLLDSPVADLPATDRFLLDATRGWVQALTLAARPEAAVTGGFARLGIGGDGVAAFDRVMRALDRGSRDTLAFQRPCHATVEETEAVVLSLWRQVRAGERAAAAATARLLVDEVSAAIVTGGMAMVSAAVRAATPARG